MKNTEKKFVDLIVYYTRLSRYLLLKFWYYHKYKIIVGVLLLAFVIVYFMNNIFISIEAGHAGVLWGRFSGTENKVYDEGFYVIAPWDKMIEYDVRIHAVKDTMDILTAQGLTVKVHFTYRYYPVRESLPELHKTIGKNYNSIYVKSEIEAATMTIIGNYTPEKLYKMSTQVIQSFIKQYALKSLLVRNIVLEDFLIHKIELPSQIAAAIESKMSKEQLLLEFDYRLNIEKKEKERKIIEAEGLKEFQNISNVPILKWRGIEATEKLANSPNSKIIMMGSGNNQLPILLNADKEAK
ncbi:MAG: prohibitin family protein [Chloroflexota bacterium]